MELDPGQPNPHEQIERLFDAIGTVVVGQRGLIEGLLVALLSRGHALVDGVPGVAKTTVVRTLAQALGLGFGRVQFTPDLLPADLVGTQIYVPDRQSFSVHRGPLFTPVLLADEINRAPAKVQSALLEAMEERQITIGDESFALPNPFFVMATQNPVELEGTYPLPEAQIDRFLVKLDVPYPSELEERAIADRDAEAPGAPEPVCDARGVNSLQQAAAAVHVAPEVRDYAVRLARATREPESVGAEVRAEGGAIVKGCVALGASPRASLHLVRAARARALLERREHATPHDVKRIASAVLCHRVIVTYEAEADGIKPETVVGAVLDSVETP